LLLLAACGAQTRPSPAPLAPVAVADAAPSIDAALPDAAPSIDAAPPAGEPIVWLRGSTHVHAKPSGDSQEPPADVVRWYEDHGYDFIVLTDHNRVTPVEDIPRRTLVVIAGTELTHNSNDCLDPPPPPNDKKCRTHVNAIGVSARPDGKIPWDVHATRVREGTYGLAIDEAAALGGIAQINHPEWHWGMTPALAIALAKRGARLFEIANVQFAKWNAGDADHLSTEALWDAILGAGFDVWGVASDDAHVYPPEAGDYPAGGGWVMVHAARRPEAIVAALAAGEFYASTGVVLDVAARDPADGGALVVSVAPSDPGPHTIAFVSGGKTLREVHERSARFALAELPAGATYVRAVVTRDADGAKAWVQPARPAH
jgi:hypothetical protein